MTALAASGRLAAGLVAVASALAVWRLAEQLPPREWFAAVLHPAPDSAAELVFNLALLPRLAVAAMAGAGLAASGAIIQHVLRNPLASPVTLGVSSGAQLALAATALSDLAIPPDIAALGGGLAAIGLVLAVASARRFSSLSLILAGLTVSLFLGSLGHALKLFNQEYLASILLWNAGALAQDDWAVAASLAPRLAALGVAAALLVQPLRLFGVGDATARGLGVSIGVFRIAALGVAVGLAAVATASVGMIGFIEIAAPLVARAAGARGIGARLALAPPIGAALLVIVDALVQAIDRATGADLPTGAATAFLAAPLLLALLPRMRGAADPAEPIPPAVERRAGAARLAALAGAALAALALSCLIGRVGPDLWGQLRWRLPRALAAGAAGAMLGTAGALLQRALGNPLAGPEVIGVGAATMAGLAVALLVLPAPSPATLYLFGAAGAGLLLTAAAGAGRRARFAPDHLLLTGVSLAAALDAVVVVFLAANDGRAGLMLNWLSGSTAGTTWGAALTLAALAAALCPIGLWLAAPLDILPLGDPDRGRRRRRGRAGAGFGAAAGGLADQRVGAGGRAAHFRRPARPAYRPAARLCAQRDASPWRCAGWRPDDDPRRHARPRRAESFEMPTGLIAALIGCPYLILRLSRAD